MLFRYVLHIKKHTLMNDTLFIPTKCKVGFNTRNDTYTGKLGYVIYHDGKTWRKEKSWEGWREKYSGDDTVEKEKSKQYAEREKQLRDYKDHKGKPYYSEEQIIQYLGTYENFHPNVGRLSDDPTVEPVEFENKPTEGFVLNKKMGGVSGYRSWYDHDRIEKVRIYDPRGFEFEITIPNLLFILQECNAYKGKGLEGEFVYAWQGAELIIIPVSCKEYQDSIEFTKLQLSKLSVKELVPGCSYIDKHKEKYVYLGKYDWYAPEVVKEKELAIAGEDKSKTTKRRRSRYYDNFYKPSAFVVTKQHVFINEDQLSLEADKKHYLTTNSMTSFSKKITDVPVSNYNELMQDFSIYKYSQRPIELREEKASFDLDELSIDYQAYRYSSKEKDVFLKISDEKYCEVSIQAVFSYTYYNSQTKYEFVGYGINKSNMVWFKDGTLYKQRPESSYRENYPHSFQKSSGLNKVLYTKEQIENTEFVRLSIVGENRTVTKLEDYLSF